MGIKIIGTGSILPEKVITNRDLESYLDTSDEWIRERTGIANRHVADTAKENVATLGAEAARRAMNMAGITADDIDLILVASCSSQEHLPCVACQVQEIIGAKKVAAFDINAACSGFMIALSVANAYIETGAFKRALVIGSEVLSELVDWNDRGTCILFGDGAGAAVVEKGDGRFEYVLGADGTGGKVLYCNTNEKIQMIGQDVYMFATKTVPVVIREVLEKAEMTTDEIDLYILHQANSRIIKTISRNLKVDIEKFPMNMEHVGNISSASIPVLLDELNQKGLLLKGKKYVFAGFGAGLTYGACALSWC